MSRNVYIIIAVAALLFASASAMFFVLGDSDSDAVPEMESMMIEPRSEMRERQGFDGHGQGTNPEMAMSPFGSPASEPPRYVIDAPDRPDNRPERIIDDYGRMYEEKHNLERGGAEVFVYDPELEKDAGRELAEVINTVFDGAIVSERPRDAETVAPEQIPDSYNVSFLELMLEQTGKDTWLGQLLSVMISQYVAANNESEGVAPSPGRQDDIIEIPSDVVREEEDENEPEIFVDDIPEYTTSSELFLIEHGFDGGTFF